MDRPLHVLHVVEEFPPRAHLLGGVRVSIRNQIEGLAEHHRITALAASPVLPPLPRYRDARARQRAAADDPPHRAPTGLRVVHRRYVHAPLLWPLTEPWQLERIAARVAAETGGIDLVHGHRVYPMGVAAVKLGRRLRVPAVITAHGSDVHTSAVGGDPRTRAWTLWALRRADHVIAVSERLRDIARACGVRAERTSYVPNGVDVERFRPAARAEARAALGLPAEPPIVLAIGNLVPVKGHAVLIDAFAALRTDHPGALLVVAGAGPLRESLEAQARARGLLAGEHVRFPGALPHEEVPRWLAAASVFALPSWNEGTPLAALEALACARPVVGTAVGGTAEVVRDDVGVLVPAGDAVQFAAALRRALAQPWDPERLRARASDFAWPRVVERIERVYASLVHRSLTPDADGRRAPRP